jgi:hypothetical protein
MYLDQSCRLPRRQCCFQESMSSSSSFIGIAGLQIPPVDSDERGCVRVRSTEGRGEARKEKKIEKRTLTKLEAGCLEGRDRGRGSTSCKSAMSVQLRKGVVQTTHRDLVCTTPSSSFSFTRRKLSILEGKKSQPFFAEAEGGEGLPLEGRHAVIER